MNIASEEQETALVAVRLKKLHHGPGWQHPMRPTLATSEE
jgi:hypothetical protein